MIARVCSRSFCRVTAVGLKSLPSGESLVFLEDDQNSVISDDGQGQPRTQISPINDLHGYGRPSKGVPRENVARSK